MSWIESARWVVENKSFAIIDLKTGEMVSKKQKSKIIDEINDSDSLESRKPGSKVVLDAYSAQALLAVHDALSADNKKKFVSLSLPRAQSIAFKLAR